MKRFEVWLVQLDPTVGAEMRKTRPAAIVSPDELNGKLGTLLAAPLTSANHDWPWRVATQFEGRKGQIALDQIRCLSKKRFRRKLGELSKSEAERISAVLAQMFV